MKEAKGNRLTTSALCQPLTWDTEFFGRRIARVTAQRLTCVAARRILQWSKQQGIECLYFLCDCGDDESIAVAEKSGFHLVDVRVTLQKRLQLGGPVAPLSAHVRPAEATDIPRLRLIARECHTESRFYNDTNFNRERAAALYEAWIERSCRGHADATLVAVLAGEAIGYVTCHVVGPSQGTIGLLGVSPERQGCGWGERLLNASLAWFQNRGVLAVAVTTQGRNLRAQRLYQRAGFTTKAVQLWYHHWNLEPR